MIQVSDFDRTNNDSILNNVPKVDIGARSDVSRATAEGQSVSECHD